MEFKDYSELQQANIALHEGGADLNVDQHTAYMEAFNRDAGADLASLTPIPTVPAGLFSSSHTSLDDVDWAVIPGSRSYAAGTDPKLQVLQEELLPELVLVAVTQSDQKDSDWAKAVVDAYHSEEFVEFLDEENKDGYWFVPEGE